MRTAAPFVLPALLYMAHLVLAWLLHFIERREDKHLKKLEDAKKKLIKELKVCAACSERVITLATTPPP
jgi:hypothetical protein